MLMLSTPALAYSNAKSVVQSAAAKTSLAPDRPPPLMLLASDTRTGMLCCSFFCFVEFWGG